MESLMEYLSLNQKSQLTLAVSQSISELQKAAKQIISEYNLPPVYINKELSQLLISEPKANYSRVIVNLISSKSKEIEKEPILITNIELLFEPSFELDPLVIFRQTSKNKMFFVLWPGEFKNNILSYASPEHAHYRTWANPGVEIIQV